METQAIDRWRETLPLQAKSPSSRRMGDLAELLVGRKVQFLCGSGMSKGSGLPLADELAATLAAKLVKADASTIKNIAAKYSLGAIAEACLQELDDPRFNESVQTALKRGQSGPHDGHKALRGLASEEYFDRIYTTNFDTLIEDAFQGRAETITDSNADAINTAQRSNHIPVIHLHGTPESQCLLTERQTYRLDTPLSHVMKADMVTSWFVWIGYSLTDVDLQTVYFSMEETLRKRHLAKRPFVIHPLEAKDPGNDQAGIEWELADHVWKARGATYIPGTAEVFLPALEEQAQRASAEGLVRKIIEKRGGDPTDPDEQRKVWEDAEAMAVDTRLGDKFDAVKLLADEEEVE